ncbi:ROK family protein [Solibacillus sp. MA9]|uniref:ROK family protein n=1 Tax=Solibacillus palustris TaxID=2908203 RepID=A0ABS9UFG4_9BACL|nr:ROK family protein [Solibacillus sp. MA9]MCH7323101.1 ROK family protein [Solibacillus sp. MA9]
MWILSADIGGTKLALAISKQEQPEKLINELEIASPQQSEALFEAMIEGFNELLQGHEGEVVKVAVGLPGILNLQQGMVVYQQNLPWRDFPLVARLQEVYPSAVIRMETDMMTAANGEYKIRHFEQETLIYLTVSTGIACCSIHEGKFLRGAGIPGEVGFSLTTKGAFFEDVCAGPGLTKWLQEKTNRKDTLQQFFESYYAQDDKVVPIIKQWQQELAQKIHSFILLLDPHVVVLGGGVMNHHPQMVSEIAQEVDNCFTLPFFDHKKGRVQASINKGHAGLIGAALL